MALITCPECSQQISDQAASCPNCGYPIQPIVHPNTVPARFVMNRKIVLVVVTLLIVGVLAGIGYAVNQYLVQQAELQATLQAEQLYRSEIDTIAKDMLNTMSDVEDMTYIAEKVWRYAIYKDRDDETQKYVFDRSYGYYPFEMALMLLAVDEEIIAKRGAITASSDKIQARIKSLVVPTKYNEFHKEFINLHVVFLRNVDLAVEQTGSYNSYSEAVVTNSERFIELYRTIDQKIPKN